MINNDEFAKRLQKVMDFYGESGASFAEKIGVQRSTISHVLSGRNKPSLEFILKVLSYFPEVELYWLINGKGEFPVKKEIITTTSKSSEIEVERKILKNTNDAKEIDRIVIFYTDGSFKSFQN